MSVRPEERDKPYEIVEETDEKETDATEMDATDTMEMDTTDTMETDTTDAMETDAMEVTETDVRTTLLVISNDSQASPPSARR